MGLVGLIFVGYVLFLVILAAFFRRMNRIMDRDRRECLRDIVKILEENGWGD